MGPCRAGRSHHLAVRGLSRLVLCGRARSQAPLSEGNRPASCPQCCSRGDLSRGSRHPPEEERGRGAGDGGPSEFRASLPPDALRPSPSRWRPCWQQTAPAGTCWPSSEACMCIGHLRATVPMMGAGVSPGSPILAKRALFGTWEHGGAGRGVRVWGRSGPHGDRGGGGGPGWGEGEVVPSWPRLLWGRLLRASPGAVSVPQGVQVWGAPGRGGSEPSRARVLGCVL